MKQKERRQFRLIILIVFLGFLGISMPYLIFPALFLNPDYSILTLDTPASMRALFLGITLAAYPFGQFIGSPVLGSLSDDYGRKKILVASLWMTAFCYLLTAFALKWESLSLLVISRLACGIMEGNIAIARAMAADFLSLPKHKTFGKIDAAASIAYLIGPFLGGLASDKNLLGILNLSTPFYCICLLLSVLAVLSSFILPTTEAASKIRASLQSRFNLIEKISSLKQNPKILFLMAVSTAFTLAVDIYYEFGPVHLTLKWDYSPQDLLPFNAILCITLALSTGWLSGKITSNPTKQAVILYSIGLFPLLLILMAVTDSPLFMWTLFGISGLVIGLASTLITIQISDATSSDIQGEMMGMQVSFRVLGDACICLLGGVMLMLSSQLILICAAMLSIAALGYYVRKNTSFLSQEY